MRRASALLVIAAGLAVAGAARATDPPIAVAVPDCATAPLSIDVFLASLRVELAAEGQPCCARVHERAAAGEPRNPVSAAIGWTCAAGSNVVTIRVRNERTTAALDRQVALADVAVEARPRALALAAAELIRSAETAPPPPAAPVPPAPPAPDADRADLDGWLPTAGAMVVTYPSGNTTLWGFRGGGEYARAGWAAALEAFVESGNPKVPLGSIDTLFAGGELQLGRRLRLGHMPFEAGLAGSLGMVRLDGVSSVAGTMLGSGSTLVVTAGGRAAYDFWAIPHDRARLRLVLEGGGVVRDMQAIVNGREAAGVTGAYAMAALAFTLGPYGH